MTDEGQLDPEIASMLRRQASVVTLPDRAEAKLYARLAASIPALDVPVSAGESLRPSDALSGAATGPIAATTTVGSKLLPLVLAFLAGGGAGAGAMRALRPNPPALAPTVVYVDRPSPTATTATTVIPTVSLDRLPSAPPSTSSEHRGDDARTSSVDSVTAERRLLDTARTALVRGEHDAALRAVGEHAKTYPFGRLEEEREAIAIRTLAEASRMDEARVRASRFRAKWPRSLLLPAVEAAVLP